MAPLLIVTYIGCRWSVPSQDFHLLSCCSVSPCWCCNKFVVSITSTSHNLSTLSELDSKCWCAIFVSLALHSGWNLTCAKASAQRRPSSPILGHLQSSCRCRGCLDSNSELKLKELTSTEAKKTIATILDWSGCHLLVFGGHLLRCFRGRCGDGCGSLVLFSLIWCFAPK